jgi:hypothetical protein
MELSKHGRYGSAPKVATLNEAFPTTCSVVEQVRADYSGWYYDLPDGYIRYYKGASAKVYEHRLVAQRVYGPIPDNSIVRHENNDRADNRAVNLRIISRYQHGLESFGHTPAEERVCANPKCDNRFKVPQQRIRRSISGNLYCSPGCKQEAERKVARPEKADLEQLMREVGNWTALGKKFGVSDNAVRKWAKQYGLDLSICDGRRKVSQ